MFYLQGKCNKGKHCPYRHPEQQAQPSQHPHCSPYTPREDKEVFIRTFRGALVHYGDGASVTSLSLASEYSSARLDGLPTTITASDVTSILEDLGHDVIVDGLRLVTVPGATTTSAYISTADLDFPRELSASLDEAGPEYDHLTARPVPPRLPSWASTRRVRCNKLKLKWLPPRKSCQLIFLGSGSHSRALRASGKFHGGRYRVLGTRVRTGELSLHKVSGLWRLELFDLPHNATEEDVRDSVTAPYDNPFIVWMPLGVKDWDGEETHVLVQELLTSIGPLDYMTKPIEHSQLLIAFAQFESDCDAREALEAIQDQASNNTNFLNGTSLEAKLLYNATFKASLDVYHQVCERIADRLDELDDVPCLNVIHKQNAVVLSLESTSPDKIAKTSDAIEEIMAGQVIRWQAGRPFWMPELGCNGSASKVLKDIQQKYGVLLLPNRSKREVRFFGDECKLAAVEQAVASRLTRDVMKSYKIHVEQKDFGWVCGTGLKLLSDVIGENAVGLDVTFRKPKCLKITGTDEQYGQALAILEESGISFDRMEVEHKDDCSICWTPADGACLLRCGHTYCAECFRTLCASHNTATNQDLSIVCNGAQDTCKNSIPLQEIQAHLDPSDFEQLLESSFDSYITHRPDQFHYCPTPDCGYLYRPATTTDMHTCTKCLHRICRRCHGQHEGQTCQAYRATQDFEAYKRKNKTTVKDCPKCQTTVEKIDGCDHITCGGCRIHICWRCLQTFKIADQCYIHMQSAHGGYGLADD